MRARNTTIGIESISARIASQPSDAGGGKGSAMSDAKVCDRCGKYYTRKDSPEIRFFADNADSLRPAHIYDEYACEFVDLCPECVSEFQTWWDSFRYNREHKKNVLYLCDQKACKECYPEYCDHTTDINHAVHFVRYPTSKPLYIEKENDNA